MELTMVAANPPENESGLQIRASAGSVTGVGRTICDTSNEWCWRNGMKGSKRDLRKPVSSLFFGADERDDYLCPWSILHREGAGRSWAINNTSNIPGVE